MLSFDSRTFHQFYQPHTPFLLFTHKGDNLDSPFVRYCIFLYFIIDFSQGSILLVILWGMLVVPDNLSASHDLYTVKVSVVFLTSVHFHLWLRYFPSQILLSQGFLIIIIYLSFLELFSYLFISISAMHCFGFLFLTNFPVGVNHTMSMRISLPNVLVSCCLIKRGDRI